MKSNTQAIAVTAAWLPYVDDREPRTGQADD
jgi:hypothetical protein